MRLIFISYDIFCFYILQQMLELGAIGAELEGRQEQLQRELDALKADARAQEATWKGLERRNVREGGRDDR